MRFVAARLVLTLGLAGAYASGVTAGEWWWLKNSEQGYACSPLLIEGVTFTPAEVIKKVDGCKLTDKTPSPDLDFVMVECKGKLNGFYIFTKTKELCETLIARSKQQ